MWKVLGWLLDVMIVLVLGWLGWQGRQLYIMQGELARVSVTMESVVETQKEVVSQMYQLKEWQAATTANRFTIQDGYAILKEFGELKEHVAKIPLTSPPIWFKEKVEHLERRHQVLGDSYADHLMKLHEKDH